MAEGIRLTGENNDDTSDDDDTKSKKKKSSVKLGASAATLVEKSPDTRTNTNERSKMKAWDKLLAGLTLEKDSKTKEKNKAAEALSAHNDTKPTLEVSLSEAAEKATVEKLEPIRELAPDEINGGEVVIDLRDIEASVDDGELAVTAVPEDSQVEQEAEVELEEVEDPSQTTSTPPPMSTGNAGSSGTSGSGRGGNNPPPPPRPTSSPPPPPRPAPQPVPLPMAYNYNAAPPIAPNVANILTTPNTLNQVLAQQQTAEQARSNRRGNFLGGVIVGGLFEHLIHKGRERRMEKKTKEAFKKQEKRLDKLEFEHQLLKTEQLAEARKAEAERYKRREDAKYQLAETARMQMAQVEASKQTAEQQEHDKAELIERLNAQAAEQERLEAEQLLKNSENRIETSAWHSIEVDKTGHAVQETDIAYGHEYYKERAHETGPKEVVTRDSVTGAAALAAVTMQQSTQQPDNGLPPMLGMPIQQSSSSSGDVYEPSKSGTSSPEDTPHTSPVSVIVLLIALAVIVMLIFILM